MPIDYSRYPPNWKSEIRPRILERDDHKCTVCGVKNYEYVFRGYMEGCEVFQLATGGIYSYPQGTFIKKDVNADIEPLSGDVNQRAVKIVLTIAHLDHDEDNVEVSDDRLASMCQKCHLSYDKEEKKRRRELKKAQMKLF